MILLNSGLLHLLRKGRGGEQEGGGLYKLSWHEVEFLEHFVPMGRAAARSRINMTCHHMVSMNRLRDLQLLIALCLLSTSTNNNPSWILHYTTVCNELNSEEEEGDPREGSVALGQCEHCFFIGHVTSARNLSLDVSWKAAQSDFISGQSLHPLFAGGNIRESWKLGDFLGMPDIRFKGKNRFGSARVLFPPNLEPKTLFCFTRDVHLHQSCSLQTRFQAIICFRTAEGRWQGGHRPFHP